MLECAGMGEGYLEHLGETGLDVERGNLGDLRGSREAGSGILSRDQVGGSGEGHVGCAVGLLEEERDEGLRVERERKGRKERERKRRRKKSEMVMRTSEGNFKFRW